MTGPPLIPPVPDGFAGAHGAPFLSMGSGGQNGAENAPGGLWAGFMGGSGLPGAGKTALIYLRVSTARQATKDGEVEGYSIPAQRSANIKKARELGATVIGEFVDAGASARSADRDGLQAMLARLADTSLPKVDYVIVHKLDRLARDRADDVAILLEIRKAGATLVSVSEQIDETPAGTLMHGIVASFAEYYSRNLSTEAKKGLAEKVRRGGTPGQAPVGYLNSLRRVDGVDVKSVIVDEHRAPHIQWAFAQYATGDWSISQLRDALEERGLKTRETLKYRGQPLSHSQVHRMLTQPYYKGQVRFKNVLYDGKHDPLVDEITWQSVQDILAGRRLAGDRSWRHGHYLKGSLVCARCGGKIGYGWSKGKGGKYNYFFCLGRHTGRTSCDLPYLPAATIEKKIAAIWSRIRFTPKTLDDIAAQATADFEQLLGQQETLAAEQRQRLIQLERQKAKLIDAYMADALPVEDLKLRQNQLATEITDARHLIAESDIERTELKTRLQIVLALLQKARTTYDTAGDQTRQLLNTAMFERFEVDSRNAGPEGNGWTPQEPLVQRAQLTETIDAVLNYHPDAALHADPIATPIGSSTKSALTSVNNQIGARNDGVQQDTTTTATPDDPLPDPLASSTAPTLTSADEPTLSGNDGVPRDTTSTESDGRIARRFTLSTKRASTTTNTDLADTNDGASLNTTSRPHRTHFGGLGRFRRTTPANAINPGHEETPDKHTFTRGSNEYNLAERARFELAVPCGTPVFKTGTINHSVTSPRRLILPD